MKLSKEKKKYFANAEKVLGKYKIATPVETVNEIIKGKSITRFGDGEFDMIYGIGMNYQKYNPELAKRLEEIVKSYDEGILVGIPNVFNLDYCEEYTGFATEFWPKWVNNYKFKIVRLLRRDRQYYSAQISRFYLDYKDKSHVGDYVENLKKIWDKKDVVIIEGEKSRLGIGNDLFDNMNSIERIICPSENAFEYYDRIYNEALKIDKNKLILLALGPTATVLSYDLYKAGYHTVDIGHVDIEYEWFLRKATKKIKIENKYVTEVTDGRTNIEDIVDAKYEKEVISKIL
jgi:glycosyltransferase family protein